MKSHGSVCWARFATAILLIAGAGCGEADVAEQSSALAAVTGDESTTLADMVEREGRPGRHHGPPPTCTADEDCSAHCPDWATGCVCRDVMQDGRWHCVPACAQDSDCPGPHGDAGGTCTGGICLPPPPPAEQPIHHI